MPKVNLTNRKLESLKPRFERVDYFDSTLPGFCVRVTSRGVKTFAVMYRHGGRVRRYTIGKYPMLSLADARNEARQVLHEATLGNDPATKSHREAQTGTFGELAEEYIRRWAKKNKRSWADDQRLLERCLLPRFKNVRASTIRRKDVRAALETIAEATPIQANRAHSLISGIYNWAISVDLAEFNPCAGLKKPSKESQRDRVLTNDEIKRLWKAANTQRPDLAVFFKLCFLTAQRSGAEVLRMRWQDVDLDGRWWTIPSEFAKNGLTHRVSLSPQAVKLIQSLPRISGSPWIFPGRTPKKHVASIQIPFQRVRKTAAISNVRIHDLRRTAASLMTGVGIPRLTVSKILNHSEPGVTAVYDRHSYDLEKRNALDRWARKLSSITSDLKVADHA